MGQDLHQQAKERYADAKQAMSEQHKRMREDMAFSNPADPQQWDDATKRDRTGRPCLTFDRTNQFIMQVVNDGRQNKPSIQVLPADSQGDPVVAEKLNGIIRHIEYVSRAGQAYDMGLECAARVGLGWIRVVPQIMRPETNEQEIRIVRVHDPLSVVLDANATETDGSDAMFGFAEVSLTHQAFKAAFPKAKMGDWDSEGWFGDKTTRICEYFCATEKKTNKIISSVDGQQVTQSEEEYWSNAKAVGFNAPIVGTFEAKERTVKWVKMSGLDILEETVFPSQYIPLVPVLGYELWIDGKRFLCGMTRRLMDGQRFHNYAASATAEAIASQPKAPFLAAFESVENFEDDWKRLASGNPAYLTYNAWDTEGRQLPQPQRLAPPVMSQGFAGLLEYSSSSMESAVGMFKANLGQQDNASSGRAIRARQSEGDTANFHYIDNLSRAIEQLGRVIVDMVPRVFDTKRQARIMGDDGKQDFVEINPDMQQGHARDQKTRKVVAINLNVGSYDVRVKAGPSFVSVREQAAQQIVDLTQGNPQLAAAMAPLLMKLQDLPDSDKAYKVALSMLPPPVQKAYEDDEGEEVPPQAQAAMQQMQQQIQELQQALDNAAKAADGKTADQDIAMAKLEIEQYKAETDRRKADTPVQQEMSGVEAELKAAQAEKTRAEAEKTRLEAMQLAFTLQTSGVSTETDENGEPIPVPPAKPPMPEQITMMEQMQAQTEALMAMMAQNQQIGALTAAIAAPKPPPQLSRDPLRVIRDENGVMVGVEPVESLENDHF